VGRHEEIALFVRPTLFTQSKMKTKKRVVISELMGEIFIGKLMVKGVRWFGWVRPNYASAIIPRSIITRQ
jgi:hypothetical protein